jgi:alkylhydroperoxidase family enzyme
MAGLVPAEAAPPGEGPRIPFIDPARIVDPAMQAAFETARREGTPRPESHAIRAHVPAVFWAFQQAWQTTFREGVCEHAIKELARLYVSRSVQCDYCGNQRSHTAFDAASGALNEDDVRELLEFEKSARYSPRQKAALRLAEAITWGLTPDDAFWAGLREHFTTEQQVELGFFIGLTMGQQRFNRLIGLDRHRFDFSPPITSTASIPPA